MKLSAVCFLIVITSSLYGKVVRYPVQIDKFINNRCEESESCSLKEAALYQNRYEVHFSNGDKSFGTKMQLSYQTDFVSDLTDYVVVQFIKGCQYETSKNTTTGEVTTKFSISRKLFDKYHVFKHVDWEIDSIDSDPVYNSLSDIGLPRHYGYRWNGKFGTFDQDEERFFGEARPESALLYVRDMPGTAFTLKSKNSITAKNISLKYKSCIYRNVDIPLVSTKSDKFLDVKPIKCFNWSSSFIYNYKKEKFDRPDKISPTCLK